ncbi:MAG: LPS export ABC transporter periplasmic protein LptC [Tannerellaceae bacterium]|nr:LPS export ABC transporter periplasmic protein LptC [Tannerellaceae bacterium]
MTEERFPGKTKHTGITTVLMTVVMLLLFSAACSNDNKDVVVVAYNPETTYGMKTTDVYTLISDSGLVKARLIADEWYVFDRATEPYWYFPEGFYAEKFDTLYQAEGSVKADTAYHWDKKGLWKLIGNVELINLKGDSIETSLMFWDQNEGLIYSDKYVRIVREDGTIITGIGFETTQEMSNYTIYQAAGEFPMNESEPDSTRTDSIGGASPEVRPGSPVRRATPPPHNPMMNPPRRNLPMADSIHLDIIEDRERLLEQMAEPEIIPEEFEIAATEAIEELADE